MTAGNRVYQAMALIVIAGGQSSRMGSDKRFLELGGKTLLERTLEAGAKEPFKERFLAVETARDDLSQLAKRYGYTIVVDERKEQGPAEGIRCGLSAMKSAWALVLSCDMPFFSFSEMATLFISSSHVGVIVPVAGGRRQMLASFYQKEMAVVLAAGLRGDERKLSLILRDHIREVETKNAACFFNVNTPKEARLAAGRLANTAREVPIISIVAPASGTGKTTFIERLIPLLREEGIRLAVLKSDAHGFDVDTEGKDTARFQKAGAKAVAIASTGGWMIIEHETERKSFAALAEKIDNVDLILTESRTHAMEPALSLWRGRGEPLTGAGIVALFAKGEHGAYGDILAYDLDDLQAAKNLCLFLLGRSEFSLGGKTDGKRKVR